MKLEEVVKLNDNKYWQCTDVQTVVQKTKELRIFTLTNGNNTIRLTEHEIQMNRAGDHAAIAEGKPCSTE